MFNPIAISCIDEELAKIEWADRIYRLDALYVFKFNISKLISNKVSQLYYSFACTSLKLVVMKTYAFLIDSKQSEQWAHQLMLISQRIKEQYCTLMNHIKRDKKVYVMDIMIFVISLLSREFMGHIFDKTKKKNTIDKKNKGQEASTGNQKGMLLIQQYTFIMITYETTGNIVSPHTFQVFRKKFTEKDGLAIMRHESVQLIVESLRHIRDNYQRKMSILMVMKYQSPMQESIQSALKVLDNMDYYEDKLEKKSNLKQDKISRSLSQVLEASLSKQIHLQTQSYTKLQKINEVSLSKAMKSNYMIAEKDLSLLKRGKRKSQSLNIKRHRQNYWRQVRSINKPVFQIKNRSNDQGILKLKQEQKNWIEILNDMKKKIKKSDIQTEKFKSFSVAKFQTDVQNCYGGTESKEKCLPRIVDSRSLSHQTPLRVSIHSDENSKQIIQERTMQKSIFKFNKIDDEINQKNKARADSRKLKKRVLDLKQQKRTFQQKCKERKTVIDQSNQL